MQCKKVCKALQLKKASQDGASSAIFDHASMQQHAFGHSLGDILRQSQNL